MHTCIAVVRCRIRTDVYRPCCEWTVTINFDEGMICEVNLTTLWALGWCRIGASVLDMLVSRLTFTRQLLIVIQRTFVKKVRGSW